MSAPGGACWPFSDITAGAAAAVRKRRAARPAIGDHAAVTAADYARLVLLAAIWGAAFIFLRVAGTVLVTRG